jgi:hypothetical protein
MDFCYNLFEKDNSEILKELKKLNYIKINFNNIPENIYKNNYIMELIINKLENLECETLRDKWRPIHFICKYSTPEMIKYIIDKGVDLECETICKMRPIHFICKYSTPEMIKYIIDKGVDLECETLRDKWRPIHFICKYSTLKMIKYIIDKDVNLD